MGEILNKKDLHGIEQKIVASCCHCLVSFISEEQLNQHLLYHKSPEFYNFWLKKTKNLEEENLEPELISEPSEYFKYRPNNENSIPRKPKEKSEWDYTWQEWDELFGQKSIEEKLEKFSRCQICNKEFIHENTLKIHQSRNCLEPKEIRKLKIRERVGHRITWEEKKARAAGISKLADDEVFPSLKPRKRNENQRKRKSFDEEFDTNLNTDSEESDLDEPILNDSSDLDLDIGKESDDDSKQDVPKAENFKIFNELTHPYSCYHCTKRFTTKTWLTRHSSIHENQRLIIEMKHPFFQVLPSAVENTNKAASIRFMPYMNRNLPRSLKARSINGMDLKMKQNKRSSFVIEYQWIKKQNLKTHSKALPSKESLIENSNPQSENRSLKLMTKSFKCNYCQTKFDQVEELEQHVSEHNEKALKLENKKSLNKISPSELENDTTVKLMAMSFKCNYCETKFNKVEELGDHILTHKVVEQAKSKSENKAPDSIDLPYTCRCCEKKFKQTEELEKHMLIHNEENNKDDFNPEKTKSLINDKFSCKFCDKTYQHEYSLKRHEKSFHLKQLKKLKQNFVDGSKRGASTNVELKSDHTAENLIEMPFRCNSCKKGFSQGGKLEEHILIHSLEKPELENKFPNLIDVPYNCNYCQKKFSLVEDLEKHNVIHSKLQSENETPILMPYICNYCEKKFSQVEELEEHMDIHEEKKSEQADREIQLKSRNEIDNKLFICNYCKKKFDEIEVLEEHVSKHQNETLKLEKESHDFDVKSSKISIQDYNVEKTKMKENKSQVNFCMVEDEFFNENDVIPEKTKSVSNGKFSCKFCDKIYQYEYSLKRHEKSSHLKELKKLKQNIVDQSRSNVSSDLSENKSIKIDEFSCMICKLTFQQDSDLKDHEKSPSHLINRLQSMNQISIVQTRSENSNIRNGQLTNKNIYSEIDGKIIHKEESKTNYNLIVQPTNQNNGTQIESQSSDINDLGLVFKAETNVIKSEIESPEALNDLGLVFKNENDEKLPAYKTRRIKGKINDYVFSCTICDKTYNQSYNLDRHLRSLTHLDKLKNKDQNDTTMTSSNVFNTMKKNSSTNIKSNYFSSCDGKSSKMNVVTNNTISKEIKKKPINDDNSEPHIRNQNHGIQAQDQCLKSKEKPNTRRSSQLSSDKSSSDSFECAHCDNKFTLISDLTNHFKSVHAKNRSTKSMPIKVKESKSNYNLNVQSMNQNNRIYVGNHSSVVTETTTNNFLNTYFQKPSKECNKIDVRRSNRLSSSSTQSSDMYDFTNESIFTKNENVTYESQKLLPFGWIKLVQNQSEKGSKLVLDCQLKSPCGKVLKNMVELETFLAKNPNIKCDLKLTNFDFKLEKSLPYGWIKLVQKQTDNGSKLVSTCQLKSPCGKVLQTMVELETFLAKNPYVKCDLKVTNFDFTLEKSNNEINNSTIKKNVQAQSKSIKNKSLESENALNSNQKIGETLKEPIRRSLRVSKLPNKFTV